MGLAVQVLQNCVVPVGSIAPSTAPTEVGDRTQWGVARDHGNRALYTFSAINPTLLRVDVASLDFSGDSRSVPLDQGAWYVDITDRFGG